MSRPGFPESLPKVRRSLTSVNCLVDVRHRRPFRGPSSERRREVEGKRSGLSSVGVGLRPQRPMGRSLKSYDITRQSQKVRTRNNHPQVKKTSAGIRVPSGGTGVTDGLLGGGVEDETPGVVQPGDPRQFPRAAVDSSWTANVSDKWLLEYETRTKDYQTRV